MIEQSDSIAPAEPARDAVPVDLTIGELVGRAELLQASGALAEAIALYKNWLAFHPDHPLVHGVLFNFAVAAAGLGDFASAINALQAALRIKPDFFPPHINIGNYFETAGRADLAIGAWRDLVGKLTGVTRDNIQFKTSALKQIARVLEGAGSDAEAEEALAEVIAIDEHQNEAIQHWIALRQRQCKWPLVPADSPVARSRLIGAISPLSLACYVDDPVMQLANAHRYNREQTGWPKQLGSADHPVPTEAPARLRIGYVSSDFRDHAVGFSMTQVFELHDRASIESFAYYCGSVRQTDGTQQRIRNGADHWIDISGLDDAAAAERIRADGIHILVDLNGYTKDARTRLFAARPAPVNVNWFGFPGTMGSPYHHYLIADQTVIPAGSEIFYTEKIVRLPCYQPNDRKRVVATTRPSRSEAGLPEEAIVYCCLNGMQKFNAPTFALWMDILRQVPGSVLWLLSGGADAEARLRGVAAESGIAPDRLIFADKKANPDHLARFPLADLFLDTMPYGAHTTAADSLWMGVPVLTVAGAGFASRVCASLVRAAGLDELVAGDLDNYVARAVALGRDGPRLRGLRQRLIDGRDNLLLFDTPLLVRSLEDLYRGMWADFAAGSLPRPDLRNLDVYNDIAVELDHESIGLLNGARLRQCHLDALERRDQFARVPVDARLWR